MNTKEQKVVTNFDEHKEHDKLLDLCTIFSPDHKLREPSIDVHKITDEVKIVIESMEYLLQRYQAFGIAAPQVGENIRIFLIAHPYTLFINPTIRKTGSATFSEESCLSIPKFRVVVPRTKYVEVSWYDIKGNFHRKSFQKQTARVIQHEYDHLEGLLIDRYEQGAKEDEALLNEYDRRTGKKANR